jgi:hypothetical protein
LNTVFLVWGLVNRVGQCGGGCDSTGAQEWLNAAIPFDIDCSQGRVDVVTLKLHGSEELQLADGSISYSIRGSATSIRTDQIDRGAGGRYGFWKHEIVCRLKIGGVGVFAEGQVVAHTTVENESQVADTVLRGECIGTSSVTGHDPNGGQFGVLGFGTERNECAPGVAGHALEPGRIQLAVIDFVGEGQVARVAGAESG